MANFIDSNIPKKWQDSAIEILSALNLDNMRVYHEKNHLKFVLDRRTVSVPEALIEDEKWREIRFLFSSIFDDGINIINYGSPNIWSEEKFKQK